MPFAITKPGGINIPAPSVYIFRLKVPSAKNRDIRRLKLPRADAGTYWTLYSIDCKIALKDTLILLHLKP